MLCWQPGSYAWHVFDAQVQHLLHDEYRSKGTTKVQADTLEELIARMEDVEPQQFLKTVREYNAAIAREVHFDPNVKDGRRTHGLEIEKSNWNGSINCSMLAHSEPANPENDGSWCSVGPPRRYW